jgi:hypothetical protein
VCLGCGSAALHVSLTLADAGRGQERCKITGTDPSRTRKRRVRKDAIFGADPDEHGKLNDKLRDMDKNRGTYIE